MNPCPMNYAFNGKPFCQDMKPIYKTYSIFDKKRLDNESRIDKSKFINNYESPLLIINENTFVEGIFREAPNDKKSNYPYPYMEKKQFPDTMFITKLKMLMDKNKKYATQYNKSCHCVICSKALGNQEYNFNKGTKTFRCQDGLMHYYNEHNVWPSKEFYWFIINY